MPDEEKRGPGRPKKAVDDGPQVKQIVRYISETGVPLNGAFPVWEVDDYLSEFINLGYKLFNTHYLGKNPEGYGVLYVLTK